MLPSNSTRALKNLGTFSTTHMDEAAKEVFQHYASLNGIDSCAYPELVDIENECSNFFLKLFHAPIINDYRALVASGSSETIFMTLLFLKNYWKAKNPKTHEQPNFIIGQNSHTAWQKAATFLDISLRFIPICPKHLHLNEALLYEKIDKNTIGMNCTLGAPTTLVFDDVEKINAVLQRHHQENKHFVPIHVDAASGGFVAPFFYPEMKWDFRLPHVVSINVSSHKFGLVYPSLGWLCVRDDIVSETLAHENDYLGKSIKRYPIQFSHSASHLVTQHYHIQTLGFQGYEKITQHLFELTNLLANELARFEQITLIGSSNKFSIPGIVFATHGSVAQLANHLSLNDWHLPTFKLPHPAYQNCASRIIIRHGFNEKLMHNLLNDLDDYFTAS